MTNMNAMKNTKSNYVWNNIPTSLEETNLETRTLEVSTASHIENIEGQQRNGSEQWYSVGEASGTLASGEEVL